MRRDGKPSSEERDPENGRRPAARRGSGAGPGRQRGFVERATAGGHSGRGSDSVLPHLRDQLRLKALLPSPYPVPESELQHTKDDHHQ
jgi:hypothetical protein